MANANEPPKLGIDASTLIPPIHVPGTFGTYQGPPRGTGTKGPAVRQIARSFERRRALTGTALASGRIALARASFNARKLAGMIPRPR